MNFGGNHDIYFCVLLPRSVRLLSIYAHMHCVRVRSTCVSSGACCDWTWPLFAIWISYIVSVTFVLLNFCWSLQLMSLDRTNLMPIWPCNIRWLTLMPILNLFHISVMFLMKVRPSANANAVQINGIDSVEKCQIFIRHFQNPFLERKPILTSSTSANEMWFVLRWSFYWFWFFNDIEFIFSWNNFTSTLHMKHS